MDSSTKERLTGALILVAALVIVVPEMLLRPASDKSAATQTPMPAADAGPQLTTYSVKLDGNGNGEPVLPAPVPAVVADLPPPSDEQQPASMPAAVPAPAAAAAAGRASTGWWVQVGSFASADNAEQLARRLRDAGFAIEVTKGKSGSGRQLHLVRAGPVQDRGEASSLQSRLKAAGNSQPMLVAP